MEEKITKHKHPSVFPPRIFEPESTLYLYFLNSSSPFLPINVFRYPLLGILHPQRGPHIALQRHKLIELAINGCSIPLLILGIKPARAIILELEPQLNGIELGMQLQIRNIRNAISQLYIKTQLTIAMMVRVFFLRMGLSQLKQWKKTERFIR